MKTAFEIHIDSIRNCTLCKGDMPRNPRPVLQVSETATILVAGQAPGNLAAESGIPFSDPSGKRLREWMGVTDAEFYDADRVAIVPMGFCFPGNDANGGDLPPMKRCAETWRLDLIQRLPNLQVTLLIGAYAQRWHLGDRAKKTLTETVMQWRELTSERMFTTPHPSWRNTGWLKRNPWFKQDVLPELRAAVRLALEPSLGA